MMIFFSPVDLSCQYQTYQAISLLKKQSSLDFHPLSDYSCVSLFPSTVKSLRSVVCTWVLQFLSSRSLLIPLQSGSHTLLFLQILSKSLVAYVLLNPSPENSKCKDLVVEREPGTVKLQEMDQCD